mmetsp:Transcript_77659/g.146659  ORF Transcript_77659/g.146659 Transcript_77659/m.146659 type:complete len:244 (+) Transcript_77659:482-1213(+)
MFIHLARWMAFLKRKASRCPLISTKCVITASTVLRSSATMPAAGEFSPWALLGEASLPASSLANAQRLGTALSSSCRPRETKARPKGPLHSSLVMASRSAITTGPERTREASIACNSAGSLPRCTLQTPTNVQAKAVSCSCRLRASCCLAISSEPKRSNKGELSFKAADPRDVIERSVLVISSMRASMFTDLESCRLLQAPCNFTRSVTVPCAAVAKRDFSASCVVRLRKTVKSLVSNRGSKE